MFHVNVIVVWLVEHKENLLACVPSDPTLITKMNNIVRYVLYKMKIWRRIYFGSLANYKNRQIKFR